jgi:hypothetical protein
VCELPTNHGIGSFRELSVSCLAHGHSVLFPFFRMPNVPKWLRGEAEETPVDLTPDQTVVEEDCYAKIWRQEAEFNGSTRMFWWMTFSRTYRDVKGIPQNTYIFDENSFKSLRRLMKKVEDCVDDEGAS